MKKKAVMQIKNSVTLKVWDSTREAERIGGFNSSLIREVCIGKRNLHKGYHWQYVNSTDLEPCIGIKKPIKCIFKNGVSRVFPSKKEAALHLKISESSVQNILLQRKKQNNHFKLLYI